MADNTVLNAGSGGDTIATEDRGSYKTPISLIDVGGRAGAEAIVGDTGVSMPVNDAGGSITVDNAGTFSVQVSNTPTVTGTGGTFPVTDSGGSLTVDDGGSSLTVDGSVSISGTVAVTDNSGSITVDAPVGTPVFVRLSDGTSAITALPITDNSGSITVDNAGTFAVQAAQSGTWNVGTVTTVTTVSTVTAVTTCSVVSSLTGSGTAHDAVDSGNPHKLGAKATTALSGLTLVASADRTDLFAGVDGVLIIRPHCNLEDIVSGVASITDGLSTTVIAAQGAGVKTYVTSVTVANTSATDVTVDLRDGTAGSVKWTFPVPNLGGVTHTFNPPLAFSANTIVAADPSAAASTVTVSISGFKSKV